MSSTLTCEEMITPNERNDEVGYVKHSTKEADYVESQ